MKVKIFTLNKKFIALNGLNEPEKNLERHIKNKDIKFVSQSEGETQIFYTIFYESKKKEFSDKKDNAKKGNNKK